MTGEDAALILEPVWQGFEAAQARIRTLREGLSPAAGFSSYTRELSDLLEAERFLGTILGRFLDPAGDGLLVALQVAHQTPATWPNAYPDAHARERALVAYWSRRFEADMNTPMQPLRKASGA